MNRTIHRFLAFFLLIMILPFAASGQTSTAITGRVSDQTGAVIPKASVIAHNALTNQDLTTVTTATGDFTFTNLRPGRYDVSATAKGFATSIEAGVELHLDAVASVRLILKPGSAKESVTVRADEVQLDFTHPSKGETFTQDELEQSPFNSGNPLMLANSEPGVIFNGSYNSTNDWVRPFDVGSINQFSSNGGVSDSNDFQIDGSPNNTNSFATRSIGYVPPVASIQEMKFISNPYDAQYGHTGGGIFDMVTKYGGNTFHGQVYEDARRTFLDANTHFNDNPINHLPKQSDQRDEYGFELDGPVVIPHFYNGHDKTFYELQLQKYRENQPQSGVASVPALSPGSTTQTAWQTGDFSGAYYWNNNGPSPVYIYNPFAITSPGPATRPQFANNYIPTNLMDPTAKAILSYLPLPNRTTPASQPWGAENYDWQQEATFPYENVVARLDRNFTENDRTYIRFAWSKNWQNNADYHGIPGAAATGVFPLVFQNHFFTADWQHTFTANSLFDTHVSFARFAYNQNQGPSPFNLSNIGLGGLSSQVTESVFPQISIGGVTEFGNWADNGGNKLTITNTISAMPMWTWVHGAHTIKIGVDYRLQRASSYAAGASSGKFADGSFWTQQNNYCCAPINQGNGLASFLLGVMDSGSIDIQPRQYFTYPYYAPFFQDDWKVKKNLTINLGLRWDLQGPPTESANKVVGAFDTTDVNPVNYQLNGALLPAGEKMLGGMTYAGVNGQPRTLFNRDKLLIQPRLGFNYALNRLTVIRGGIGTTYMQFPGQGFNQGFSQSTSYVSSTDYGQTVNGNLISNPFPTIAKPAGSSLGLMSSLGNYFNVVNRGFKIPGVLNYSLGVERQIGQHATVDVSYVGTRSFHGDSSDNINHVSAQFQASCNMEMGATTATWLDCQNAGNNNKWVTNPFAGVAGFSPAVTGNLNNYYYASQLPASIFTRPYPEFGDITQTEENDGYSEYDSFQAVVSHHWSDALVFHGNFVWSKQMDGGGWSDNVYRIRQHYLDTGNPAWRLAANAVWHLPVGRGRTFLANTNRVLDSAVGNWIIGAIYTYQAGLPSPVGRPWAGRAGGNTLEVVHKQHYGVHRLPNDYGNAVIRGANTCVGWYDPNPQDNAPNTPSYGNAPYSLGDVEGQDYTGCQVTSTGHVYDFIARPSYAAYQNVSDAGVRLPRGQNLDLSMSKSFSVWREMQLQLRFEGYNVLNHPSWAGLDYWWDIFDPHFGTENMTYDGQSNIPRNVQLSAKIIW